LKNKIFELASEFTSTSHGSTDYDKDTIYVMGKEESTFVPLNYLAKADPEYGSEYNLKKFGFTFSSADFVEKIGFKDWYQKQFGKKLTLKTTKIIGILHYPDTLEVLDQVEIINKAYENLRDNFIINNGENFPIQLGEWYAKCIFGLKQLRSTSMRGFDFFMESDKKVEVKVHWNDVSSPKGIKLKKSLIDMSDYTIVMYIGRNFMLRDILFLDSDFISRKFAGKGHTIFLKDKDVSNYFFSKSDKHFNKVVNKGILMRFANSNYAMTLDGRI
jgi:hypothetical protein